MYTFLTEKGRMPCLRIPLGMSISSDEFLSRCYLIFEGIPNIVLLINDVHLHAKTLPELLRIMPQTLDRCIKYNVSFGLAKMVVAGPGEYRPWLAFASQLRGLNLIKTACEQ